MGHFDLMDAGNHNKHDRKSNQQLIHDIKQYIILLASLHLNLQYFKSSLIIQKQLKILMNAQEINELIIPYQIFYDEESKRNYFFNTENGQSVWELPKEQHAHLQNYLSTFTTPAPPKLNLHKYLPKQFTKKEFQKYKQFTEVSEEKPARKQVETSLANNYTYKEGDQEYNFWYSKYICAKDQKEKEAALTRCDPELDVGYTAADLFNDKNGAFFCLFFARGCCANGVNCRFYHRVPSMQDCELVDQHKDIFGRARFSSYRQDMKGVGSFAKQTRAIYVSDYKLPNNDNGVTQMYEILLRHFSLWGEIEDINILPHKGYAFIKFKHRCMAEYAKQAMTNQSLDSNQIITIKWANEDPNPRVAENEEKDERRMLLGALDKKRKEKQKQDRRKQLKEKRSKALNSMMKNYKQK